MPPPKKDDKDKKDHAHGGPHHEEGKDLRRAYEHRGRVDVLRPFLAENAADVDSLIQLAEQELAASHGKDAADLLRAAEHLSFGLLAASEPDAGSDKALSKTVEDEFQHKLKKAEEHWEPSDALTPVYQKTKDAAKKALESGAHRKALELVRAAEAIAHVHLHHGESHKQKHA